jgi:hypothetical protein
MKIILSNYTTKKENTKSGFDQVFNSKLDSSASNQKNAHAGT